MLRIICIFIVGLSLSIFDAYTASTNPKEIIHENTKLVYDVYDDGNYYEIILTIKYDKDNMYVDWKMSEPAKKSGTVFITKNDLENGDGFYKFFTKTDSSLNLHNQNCIFISNSIYNKLSKNNSATIFIDNKKTTPIPFGNLYHHTQNFGLKNNFAFEFNCTTITNDDYQITYVNDAAFPLIVELKLDYTIKLKKIIP